MKRSIGITLGVLFGCVRPYVDAELRDQRSAIPVSLGADAPTFEYDLVVATGANRPFPWTDPSSLAERVGVEVDDLLRRRGVQPIRREPGANGSSVHLTFIHGPWTTVLWAESRAHRSGRRSYAGPSDPVRNVLAALLEEVVIDFPPRSHPPTKAGAESHGSPVSSFKALPKKNQ